MLVHDAIRCLRDLCTNRRRPSIRQCPSHEEVTQLLATVADLYGYPTGQIP